MTASTASEHPYKSLPPEAFWRSAVASVDALAIHDLWQPGFSIDRKHRIVTAGSCFAQHIGRALVQAGYRWVDAEPAPAFFTEAVRREFNYGIFSFRTGNIYTAAALRQWVEWAFDERPAPDAEIWEKDGRFYDPFRPQIEPQGFETRQELIDSRASALRAIRQAMTTADVIVFTLGLTEAWRRRRDGLVYAMCPGVAAGEFDGEVTEFVNFGVSEVVADMTAVCELVTTHNKRARFLLTVSPVPLTATASGEHVLVATNRSKAVLRAAASALVDARPRTFDYFPSYEIITGIPFRARFFESNLRSVTQAGVQFVMRTFFSALGDEAAVSSLAGEPSRDAVPVAADPDPDATADESAVVCEEVMLEAFGPGT